MQATSKLLLFCFLNCLLYFFNTVNCQADYNDIIEVKKVFTSVGVKGRLICGQDALENAKIKLINVEKRPKKSLLLAETRTDENGFFELRGGTKQHNLTAAIKIYFNCGDNLPCERKFTFHIPSKYHFTQAPRYFDLGTLNTEVKLLTSPEERDCRH
uniref:Transthyretin-like family-containing protein n=1 Tax=Rhabditophanes sp. KR3021 TaxID=114890 RepID=A0AC35UH56_9BILA